MPPPQLPPDVLLRAIISDIAYGCHRDNGVEGQYSGDRAETKHKQHVEQFIARGNRQFANYLSNYKIVKKHCDQNTVTVVNEKTKEVIIGYRGSNSIFTWNGFVYDWLANNLPIALQSFGLRRPRTAAKHADAVMKDFGPQYKYSVTGHSQGGSTAEFVSRCYGIRGDGFNGGSGMYNVLNDPTWIIEGYNDKNRYTNYRIDYDIVSGLHAGKSYVFDKKPDVESRHSLSNFIEYGGNNGNNNTDPSLGGVDFSGASVRVWPNHSINIGSISGAIFSGFTAKLLADKHSDNSSKITMQDFAVALVLAHFGRDPAFSLDPWEPTKPDGPWLRCVYYPEHIDNNLPFSLAQTDYGRTMFEADWLLKQLSMGVDLNQYTETGPFPSPLPVRIFPPGLRHLGLHDRFELENSHQSSSSTDKNPRYTRLWITVNREDTIEGLVPPHETFPVSSMSCSEQMDLGSSIALHFSDVKLGVQVMRMARGTTGKLEDVSDPRLSEPTSSEVIFARLMTDHYDEVARHYPQLRRLKELAKLQGIAKWMMENDVDVDINEALKYIRESTSIAIEKVPALERQSSNLRVFGGVNLSVRQKYHDRAPDYSTLEKHDQTELKNMIRQCISTTTATENESMVIRLPFIKKKYCSVCDRPLDFVSLFKPSTSSSDVAFCNEHHPDACYQCMLPLYVDPTSGIRITDGVYQFISISNLTEHGNDMCRYHPACFLCDVCETPITDGSYRKDPDVLHVYYHLACYSPIISDNQRNTKKRHDIVDPNLLISDEEQVQLEMVLLQSRQEYESQQKATRSTDYSIPHQDSHSFLKRQSPDNFKNQIAIPLTSEDEDSQLAMGLQLSMQINQSMSTIDKNNEYTETWTSSTTFPEYIYDPVTPISIDEHFSCSSCGNKFKTWIDLEDHTQLHFDN